MDAIKKILKVGVVAMGIFAFSPGISFSEDYSHLSTHYYDIRPVLTITKPIFSISKDISPDTNVTMRLTADRVETDTTGVDAISGASQYTGVSRKGADSRKEIAVAVIHAIDYWKIEPGYVLSTEKDYKSQVLSISISKEFFQRNTTLAIGYAHNFDVVHGVYMPSARDKDMDSYSLSLTQVLNPGAIMQMGYTFSDAEGYMGTGNRRVMLTSGVEMEEYLPEERKREAAGIRIAQWLSTEGSIQLSYRYYRDNWRIDSHTSDVQFYQYLTDDLLLRLEYRYYTQGSAYFVKDSYTGAEKYLTSANSLRAFNSNLYGIKLIYTIKRAWDWDLEAKHERYIQSPGIEGDIFMLGIRLFF